MLQHNACANLAGALQSAILGKLERLQAAIKRGCICPSLPLSLDGSRIMVEKFAIHSNDIRPHNTIGYVASVDKLNGQGQEIFKKRDRKLDAARQLRKRKTASDTIGNHDAPSQEDNKNPIISQLYKVVLSDLNYGEKL